MPTHSPPAATGFLLCAVLLTTSSCSTNAAATERPSPSGTATHMQYATGPGSNPTFRLSRSALTAAFNAAKDALSARVAIARDGPCQ